MWLGGKTPYTGGGMIADVKPQHRLPATNPTFRGNVLVAEGTQSGTAILNQSDGILLQELPFSIELKKFIVEHYSTGMPKLFASEIVIHDHAFVWRSRHCCIRSSSSLSSIRSIVATFASARLARAERRLPTRPPNA